jgi:hypothetical protein
MSERDEAVIDPVKKLTGRAGVRRVATSMNQVQSILKDLHSRAFMTGRRYEQALTRGPGPGERRTNQRKRRFS